MQHSFFQRALMTIAAGLVAASLVYFYRHVVEQSRKDMNENWRESTFGTPAPK